VSSDAGIPPEISQTLTHVSEQAHALLAALESGRLTLTVAGREGEQLRRLESDGWYAWPQSPCCRARAASAGAPGLRSLLPSRGATQGRSSSLLLEGRPALNGPAQVVPTPPSLDLLRALVALAKRSTPGHPVEIMTLLRPPYRTADHPFGSPTNVHSRGMAADIAAYAGHRIDSRTPEESVRMLLAMLRDLPPGRYRLGVPKAPELPAVVGKAHADLYAVPGLPAQPAPALAPAGAATAAAATSGQAAPGSEKTEAKPAPKLPVWPFFPPQQFALEGGVVAPERREGRAVHDGSGRPVPLLLRFRNEEYAPEEALGDPRVKRALAEARTRGVDVWALFPDAADHVHLDVRQPR
jgi:hypothetical protein